MTTPSGLPSAACGYPPIACAMPMVFRATKWRARIAGGSERLRLTFGSVRAGGSWDRSRDRTGGAGPIQVPSDQPLPPHRAAFAPQLHDVAMRLAWCCWRGRSASPVRCRRANAFRKGTQRVPGGGRDCGGRRRDFGRTTRLVQQCSSFAQCSTPYGLAILPTVSAWQCALLGGGAAGVLLLLLFARTKLPSARSSGAA